ncbi:hypothetical protein ACG7TL_002148 [Trametes sanguinea]
MIFTTPRRPRRVAISLLLAAAISLVVLHISMRSLISPGVLVLPLLSSLLLPEYVVGLLPLLGLPTLRPAALAGRNVSDVNAGVDLKRIKTIVAFGDSYTDGGRDDGGPLAPPVVVPPDAEAGGRSTDGKVWVEDIADDIGATLKDYATFLNQSNDLDPDTTLYAIFFGINDYEDSKTDGTANLQAAAQVILNQTSILASPPTNARNFLITDVYGRGTHTPEGDAMVQTIFSGLAELRANASASSNTTLNFAFAEFARIWDGVLDGNPGYEAFGYVSTDACIVDCTDTECTTDGMCDDPDHYFYYIPGHPSKEGHRIMADYVEEVLTRCVEE